MKLLITTRADKGIKHWTDITHPIIKDYANKVGADFEIMSHKSNCNDGDGKWHYRIFKHKELHEKYDRILHIDSDILLVPDCPNIFEIVPYNSIATVYEDKGSRKNARRHCIMQAQTKWGDIDWREGYMDSAFFLTSKCHKNIYETINGEYWTGFGYDDVHMGYLINKYGYDVHELSYKWNHMTMFSEEWNNNANRFESYAIHYGGAGIFEQNISNKLEQMILDKKRWKIIKGL
jgi:lipopolysaccharide biosynthesis glycosyltransferase